MAVDSRNKRASLIGVAMAARLVLPASDGTIAQADRQQLALLYASGAAALAVVPRPVLAIFYATNVVSAIASEAD